MHFLRFLLIVWLLGVFGCGKDEPEPVPTFSSVDGKWTYRTPDKKIDVDFELSTNATGELNILNATISINGTVGQAAAQIFDVNLPAIDSIRINANDASLTYPYYIAFSGCTLAEDFVSILVTEAEYTDPQKVPRKLSGIAITRKQ